jgi:hypothetical protein
MNEIICPNCNKAFKVDEAGFADILKQVRDHEFEKELANRLDLAEKEKIVQLNSQRQILKLLYRKNLQKKINYLLN